MGGLVFCVPPGIGDISWIYSKVSHMARKGNRRVEFKPAPDLPSRADSYVKLLPGIEFTGSGYPYGLMINKLLPTDTDLESLPDGEYMIGLNLHLEQGKFLHDAFPKQPTDYHYSLNLPPFSKAVEILSRVPGDLARIGFYCSSHIHRPELGFWSAEEWVAFLKMVKAKIPNSVFVAVGAPYDDKTKIVAERVRKSVDRNILVFMNQGMGDTLNAVKSLHYFFAFPSGLGILADVVDVPCMMWFWGNVRGMEHMKDFFGKYADPKNVESGRHLNVPYVGVGPSFDVFLDKGIKWLDPCVRGGRGAAR